MQATKKAIYVLFGALLACLVIIGFSTSMAYADEDENAATVHVKTWAELDSAMKNTTAQTIVLDNDVKRQGAQVETSKIYVNGTKTLNLNGHVIASENVGWEIFVLKSGSNLTIDDTAASTTHFFIYHKQEAWKFCASDINEYEENATIVDIDKVTDKTPEGAFVRVPGGSICGGGKQQAGCIDIESGATCTLVSGNIIGNRGSRCGGVVVSDNATFTMKSGRICGNEGKYGGGVWTISGHFVLESGSISHNCAEFGGGVCNEGTMDMNGGEISYNFADRIGGGLNNGKIEFGPETTSTSDKNSNSNATFYMRGGTIKGNTADRAAGIGDAQDHSSLYLHGGQIINNIAKVSDGAITVNAIVVNLGGSIVIKDNYVNKTKSNLCIKNAGLYFGIDQPLTAGASIGISAEPAVGPKCYRTVSTPNKTNYTSYFTSDNIDLTVMNSKNNEIQLYFPLRGQIDYFTPDRLLRGRCLLEKGNL